MFGRCAVRLRQCIHLARKRGVLSRRSAAGSGSLVARHRQVHAPCEAETGNGHKRRSAKQAHRCGVLGYKGARRKRLVQRNAWEAAADVKRQFSNDMSPRFADRGRANRKRSWVAPFLMGWSAAVRMNGGGVPMQLHTIGIDLGKTVFHLVGLNLRGEVVLRKKFSRKQLLHFTVNLRVELIGMEACGGSHFLGRALREQGHEMRLMPAQYVKPYVKTNKSDYIDAEAIAEAVQRPRMRFVPIKSEEQLDLQALHRVRERWVMRRTAVVNQIRSLLLERGLTLPKGRGYVDRQLPRILEDAELNLSD